MFVRERVCVGAKACACVRACSLSYPACTFFICKETEVKLNKEHWSERISKSIDTGDKIYYVINK